MVPDHSRNHPYQTPASVRVTITIGTTIVEGTGDDSRAPPRGELSHAKKQVAAPADLFAEEDDREDDDGYDEVEDAPAEARRQAWKVDYPEGGRDAEAQGDDRRRPEDGDE